VVEIREAVDDLKENVLPVVAEVADERAEGIVHTYLRVERQEAAAEVLSVAVQSGIL
jgi:RNA binding exosome subunit